MTRDARGNEIKEGDTVSLEIPSTRVVGDIAKISTGGIVTGIRGGHSQMTAGQVTVLVAFSIPLDPTNPVIQNCLKLHSEPKPPSKGLVELN